MSTSTTAASGPDPDPEPRPPHSCSRPECLCAGSGPALSGLVSEAIRRYGPPPEVRKHFEQAHLEILKGLRALLDDRIGHLQKDAPSTRGAKVPID